MSSEIETENTSSAAAAGQPPPTAGMTTKVVKGSLWTLAGQVAPLGVSLVTTPFTIRLLGAEGYGVLVLIGLIPTYLGFADFGMSMASTKFGSEAYAEGDPEKEARIIRTAAAIALASSLPVAALLMIFAGTITGLFNVPEHLAANATAALRIAAVGMVINFLCGIFNTPQLARLRMDLNTLITAIPRILGQIATPIAIYLGYGITGAMSALLAASVLTLFAHIAVSGRLLPQLFEGKIDRTRIRPLLNFGTTIVISLAAGVLLANVEKLVLPRVTSVTILAYYSVAFTVATALTLFSSSMLQSLIPAFSRIFAVNDLERAQDLYSRTIRINLIAFLPIASFLMLAAKPFFTVWAGENFGLESTPSFYVLLVGLMFSFTTPATGAVMVATQNTKVMAILYWAEIVPYIALAAILTHFFGAVGAAMAWSARMLADAVILLFIVDHLVGLKLHLTRAGIFRLVTGIIMLSAGPVVSIFVPGMVVLHLAIWVPSLFLYLVFMWFRGITSIERELIKRKISTVFA